jgi:dihydrofolate synthase/folylpolyglutamate synthase
MSPEGDGPPIRTLAQAAAWLESLINVEKRPDWSYARFSLAPIHALLERLGRPDRSLRILHIAGSKGKGSTALLAEAVLSAAGRRVGTFTSPHLERWTERFRVGGREVDEALLASAVDRVRPHVEALRASGAERAPTFFDATTAVALLLFREAGVDDVVLEVGLGGRLDSTNAVTPRVTCVTHIELEHTDRLGDTLEAIASEKAGILEPGVPAVTGALAPEAARVVAARAEQIAAPLVRLGREFVVESGQPDLSGVPLHISDGPLEVVAHLPLQGAHQPANAALAVACVRRLLGDTMPLDELARAARRGLEEAELPGRLEILRLAPLVLVDAAHTAASAQSLADVLQREGRRAHFVLSVSAGKNIDAILGALLPVATALTLTRAEPTRSLDPAAIAAAARARAPQLALRVVPNPHLALRAASENLAAGDTLCATGSVYLAGIARRVLRDPKPAARLAATRRHGRGPVAGA